MMVRDRKFSQLEPGATTATVADGPGVLSATFPYYKLAVAAGLTVWLVSKILDGAFFRKRKE